MGVQGLLPLSAAASRPINVSELRGSTAAVDSYCWLHRGALPQEPGAHVKYCMKYVNMLLSHNVKPILVFDGRHLPAKAKTEEKRRESRDVARKRAAELLRLGKLDEARSQMRRCIDITHEMALELIKECRKRNVDCIVAPYEADAQLAYLNRKKIADIVITEDSDLILFGCNRIIFKMDLNGNGVLIESAKLPLVMKCPLEQYSFDKFRHMCILSGCDYLPSLPGIGLAKARQFVNATRDPNISNALRKLPSYFNKNNLQVTEEYRNNFLIAEATFKHQMVYDPVERKMRPLIDIDDEGTDPQYCCNAGGLLDPDIAFQLALGNLDPFTLKRMDNWDPDNRNNNITGGKTNNWNELSIAPHKSIWSKSYMESIKSVKKGENIINAISISNTRPVLSKAVITAQLNDNEGLTIENLSSMYCIEPPKKKKKLIIPETQDFEDDVSMNITSDSLNLDKDCSEEDQSNTSPILQKNNRTYKKLLECGSFNKFKKISKFQRTTMESTDIIQSKFFDEYTPESSVESQKENILNSEINDNCTILSEVNEFHLTKSLSIEDGDGMIISELNSFEEEVNIKPETQLKEINISICNKNPFKLEHFDESKNKKIVIDNNLEMLKNDELDNSRNVMSNTQSDTRKPSIIVKNNTCRRPGLQKKKNPDPKQQTLLTGFGFQKKSQLKHSLNQ